MKTINKNIITALLACAICSTAYSVPADPRMRTNIQQGGTILSYYVVGDEHGHISLTTDGKPLIYNNDTQSFEYATVQNGIMTSSGIIAKNPEYRTAIDIALLENIKSETAKEVFLQKRNKTKQKASGDIIGNGIGKVNNYPTKGFRHSPVILIEFGDLIFSSMSNAKDYYTEMLNATGFDQNGATGSVRDYYVDNSRGQFDVQYDVYGPVQLSMPHSYYGSSDAGTAEALYEACQKLDKEIDFSQYDTDGDGRVDNIFFFYAGYGEADSGDPNDIWPCSWDLLMAGDTLVCDGKLIGSFACSNEIKYDPEAFTPSPTGIGTFVHEFGHVLGLPDMYDTGYNILSFTSGYIDLMDKGSYLNDSNTPPNLSGYEKYILGWAEPAVINMDADSLIMLQDITHNEVIQIETGNENENFFIENRQQNGWDTYLPLHGMLVWHVDYDSLAFHSNVVNNDYSHPRVDLIEADGILTANTRQGDSFPGSAGITTCNLTTWDGTEITPYPDFITERDGIIMFVPGGVSFKPDEPQNLHVDNTETTSITISWDEVKDALDYEITVKSNGDIIKTYNNITDRTIKITGLNPDTEYEITVTAMAGTNASDSAVVYATTVELPFNERQVIAEPATNVTKNGFTANWLAMKDAVNYELSVSRIDYNDSGEEQGYDFSDGIVGLPVLWETSSTMLSEIEGRYGESAPSLRMSSDGDYITIAFEDSKIKRLDFWYCSAKENGKIYIEALTENEWQITDSITNPKTTGINVTFLFDDVEKVRIRYQRTSGYITIDDIVATVSSVVRISIPNYNPMTTGNVTSVNVSSLATLTEYRYTITAIDKNGNKTVSSDEIKVITGSLSTIEDVKEDVRSNDIYTIDGMKIKEITYPGIYIINGQKVIINQ